jgi:hypothetical protein
MLTLLGYSGPKQWVASSEDVGEGEKGIAIVNLLVDFLNTVNGMSLSIFKWREEGSQAMLKLDITIFIYRVPWEGHIVTFLKGWGSAQQHWWSEKIVS